MAELEPTMEQLAYQQKEVKWFLDHEAVKAAFRATEQAIFKQWTTAETPERREWLRQKYDAFKDWQRELRGIAGRLPKLEE